MHSGNFVLTLHTHLPWVLHHGGWPHGEDWLTEAAAECYIPLLNVFGELAEQGIPPKVTIDISPVLCEQLEHPNFKPTFEHYLNKKIAAALEDEKNFTDWGYDPHHIYLAKYWADWYEARKNDFIYKYKSSIVGGLKALQDAGQIEIATCGATHGYLPLLGYDKSCNLQMKAAVENYKKHFGRRPRGTWIPECAYRPSYIWHTLIPVNPFHQPRLRPGVEQILAANGLEYFFIDQKLIENSLPLGVFLDSEKEKFIPIHSPDFRSKPWNFDKTPLNIYEISSSEKTEYGTAVAFARHRDIAMQVWSGEVGYPGQPDYLDFHKKHLGSMLRYWRVTDNKADMMYKTLYHPDWTKDKTDLQSNHFIHHIENSLNYYRNLTGKSGTLCTPFDTELFGHWWFEGPEFVKALLKGLAASPYVNSATASEELIRVRPREVMAIPEGSWGENNNHDVWSNKGNVWTWEAIYNDELRLNNLLAKYPPSAQNPVQRDIFTQALRELMLLQSSDWQFLIYTKSAKDYSEQRFSSHHSDFNKVCDLAEKYSETNEISPNDKKYFEDTKLRNSPFAELQLEWWSDLSSQ